MRCVDVKRVKPLGLSTKFVPQSLLFVAPPGISETGVHLINLRGLHQKYNSLALHPLLHYYYQLNPIGKFLNNWIVGNWTLCSLLKADLRNNKFFPRFRYLLCSHQKIIGPAKINFVCKQLFLILPLRKFYLRSDCLCSGSFIQRNVSTPGHFLFGVCVIYARIVSKRCFPRVNRL